MRVLSGIQPTGRFHWGNYFGAIRQYINLQTEDEAYYFIANLHALTTVRDKERLQTLTYESALDLLALGLDPEQASLFVQSEVPEISELTWILMTGTPMGLLERCHAYKEKREKGIAADAGLFTYPVLMAADILLYGAEIVPVGQDQKQHVEMTRDMAQRFNHAYDCEALILPEPYIMEDTAIVPGTDGRKMSKSYDNTIQMFAPKKALKKSVMGIQTDSTPVEEPKDPDTAIFQIWNLFTEEAEREEMADRARQGGLGYGDVKKELLERILDYFGPMRERREQYEARPDEVEEILVAGADKARSIAESVLEGCRQASGLGRPG